MRGAVQDGIEVDAAKRMARQRHGNGRSERAWKYFEPVPAEPRAAEPDLTPVGAPTWLRTVAGVVALPIAVLAPFSALGPGHLDVALPALLLFAIGAACVVWFGLQRDVLAGRLERHERQYADPGRTAPPVSPGHWVRTAFVEELHRRVEARFAAARPHVKGEWSKDSRGAREHLKARLVASYGNAQVSADQVDWLIRWHAERVARQWRADKLFAYRDDLRPPRNTVALFALGFVLAACGVIVLLGAGCGFVVTALLLGAVVLPGMRGATSVVVARRVDREQRDVGRQLLADEWQAYREWQQVLSDQPTDAEMAHWLTLDKAYLKERALRRCSLTNRDLVSHAVLTEGRAQGGRARVVGGPWRYRSYHVLVFLLTRSGVREVDFQLDLLNGAVTDERRMSFRYDALAAARVREDDAPEGVDFTADDRTVRSRTFQLSLLSGESIAVRAQGFDDATVGSTESEDQRTALVSAGISGALHLLETVTAEGRDWLAREQERLRHQAEDFQDPRPFDSAGWVR